MHGDKYEVVYAGTTSTGRELYNVVRTRPTIIAESLKKAEAEALAKALNAENKDR